MLIRSSIKVSSISKFHSSHNPLIGLAFSYLTIVSIGYMESAKGIPAQAFRPGRGARGGCGLALCHVPHFPFEPCHRLLHFLHVFSYERPGPPRPRFLLAEN
jgi:hypothetical protein